MSTLVAKFLNIHVLRFAFKFGRAWLAILIISAFVYGLDSSQLFPSINFTIEALLSTAPFVIFAVLSIGYLKASGAETVIAKAFEGKETRMIFLAALIGGLAPFCSCEVIPFIAGLLALGTPLSAVMAFWLASPLIDPPALLITASALGWNFAIAKMVAAVSIGLFGGFAIKTITSMGYFTDPLRPRDSEGGCGCGPSPFEGKPVWKFWVSAARRQVFTTESQINALFLLKWLTLAYLLESLMITYIPAETIASVVGGPGVGPVILSAVIGAPAYLNSYAAPALVSGLIEQGMSVGAGMAFMISGAISCIPAMTAVFALVKKQVFAAYVLLGFTGAVLSGLIYGGLFG